MGSVDTIILLLHTIHIAVVAVLECAVVQYGIQSFHIGHVISHRRQIDREFHLAVLALVLIIHTDKHDMLIWR